MTHSRYQPPPSGAHRRFLGTDRAHDLLLLLAGRPIPERPTLIGVDGTGAGVRIHERPLTPDDRGDVACLFGWHAPDTWHTLGILAPALARPVDNPGAVTEVVALVTAARDGSVHSSVTRVDDGATLTDGAPQGLVVDTLRRCLHLPSEATLPSPLLRWLDELLCACIEGDSHLERLIDGGPDPEAWTRLHRRARMTGSSSLDGTESTWMDTPMFARWVADELPDLPELLHTLEQLLPTRLIERLVTALRRHLDTERQSGVA